MDISTLQTTAAGLDFKPLPRDLEGACRALEATFAGMVFNKMHEVMVPGKPRGSSGFARQTTETMLNAQWASLSSQGEGLGIWRALYRQLESQAVKSEPQKADQKGTEGSPAGGVERPVGRPENAHTGGLAQGRPLAAMAVHPGVPGLLRREDARGLPRERTGDTP